MIKFKLLLIIILSITTYSCNGQKNKEQLQNITSEKNLESTSSNTKSIQNSFLLTDSNKQINQVVRTVFQDSKRNLWFGTESGAYKFNGDSLTLINTIVSQSGKRVTIKSITESKDGKIWFGHTNGVSSIDGELVSNYYESDGLKSNDVWCIATDIKGHIWIGTINGVSVFDGKEFTDFELPEGKIDSSVSVSSSKMVHSIMEDSNGTLWLSTNAGLFSYLNHKLVNVSEENGIETNFFNQIIEDTKGDLWVASKKGLYHIKGNTINNITDGEIENGKGIGSIEEDKDGRLWFVSNQHFLYTYDGGKLSEFHKPENNKGPVIFQIYKDLEDRLWFVGFGGAYRLENGEFLNITKDGPW